MPSQDRPRIAFDHHTPEFGQDTAATTARLRGSCPMGFTDAHDGYWVASTYEHARRVLSDTDNFTVEKSADGQRGGKLIPTAPHAPAILPGALDGPAHDRLRKPLRSVFAKRSIEQNVAPIARRVADELLGGLVGRDEFDVAHAFSFRLTVATISEFVGLDELAEPEKFILMLEDAFAIDPEAGGDRDALAASTSRQFAEASDLVRDVVRRRAADPRDDLVSHMVDPSSGLTEDEVVNLSLSMLLGGVRTTAASMDNIVLHLGTHPDLRRSLVEDPSLIPAAVEEMTRLASVTPLVARTAVTDQDFGDVHVEAGDRVAALICSANRDEDRFPDAEQVRLDRRGGLHLAFGVGTHYCLGIWLAHMELRVAVEAILRRMPDYEVVLDRVRRYSLVGVNNGFAALPVRPNV
ncbi:cytochrome P450 [Pseudonocardia endophytica]|uniref:Cytochrome P450 n=1 Tax=Pseudonocardia endophytica TaxID=401976 RepID=A0A4R1HLU2_PSEEN|nr:cytochrome P450 [Pseudonocardia endophytica]TCK21993.1 cytochrome P450 [Pseudonocardia endophytica]